MASNSAVAETWEHHARRANCAAVDGDLRAVEQLWTEQRVLPVMYAAVTALSRGHKRVYDYVTARSACWQG